MLFDDTLIRYEIEVNYLEEFQLLAQLGFKVGAGVKQFIKSPKKNKIVILECTEIQYKDFQQLRNFYSPIYKKEREEMISLFESAFMSKNDLFVNKDSSDIEFWEYLPEEQEKIIKYSKLVNSLKKHHFLKQLH